MSYLQQSQKNNLNLLGLIHKLSSNSGFACKMMSFKILEMVHGVIQSLKQGHFHSKINTGNYEIPRKIRQDYWIFNRDQLKIQLVLFFSIKMRKKSQTLLTLTSTAIPSREKKLAAILKGEVGSIIRNSKNYPAKYNY